ncbi:hypothetical protein [Streptomyces sp. L2]|uniref:hypothetical protein n=1 Tax=Streptomyces sp. L2 TaxID=2162665 RepID=UPI0013E8FCFE|nr:hypothetical protein [Streptomyces sp. L2]
MTTALRKDTITALIVEDAERLATESRAFEAASTRFDVPLYGPDGTTEPAR